MSLRSTLHAIDMLMVGDWERAGDSLRDDEGPVSERLSLLVSELDRQERERRRLAAVARHEIGNALSVAIANVEGMIDGVLAIDDARMAAVHRALTDVAALLNAQAREMRSG